MLRALGWYYVVTGLWPLASMRSFEAITGPKRDRWLVHMVGLLAAAIGATLISEPGRECRSARRLALASAASFAAIDFAYVAKRRISAVYLLDGIVEVAFIGASLSRFR
jgi:hypothetical protein